ncbi:MAG: hypothetical protein IJ000_02850 [Paludibacteraceae bacterium]|nr:hypothetical protein [Paludibacteraceae bacterium]
MKNVQNIIPFEQEYLFKSKLLSILIASINATACVVFIEMIVHLILKALDVETDLFLKTSIGDVLSTFMVMLVIEFLFNLGTNTKVYVDNRILQIQTVARFFFPRRMNIMEIEKVIVRTSKSIVVVVDSQNHVSTSIKDYTKFVTLLQELNPAIEVEYKE